jgi:ethanolamine utilization protein EutN
MRVVEVIGSVTLSRVHPSLVGARWLVAVPYSLAGLKAGRPDGEDLVLYDDLGAGLGSQLGLSEGGEAANAFYPNKKPIDAYCALLIDQLVVAPE